VGQFLSKKRTAEALAELFGTPVGDGTVATMTQRAAEGSCSAGPAVTGGTGAALCGVSG
jgi:transposase